jgi:hypothetical protein
VSGKALSNWNSPANPVVLKAAYFKPADIITRFIAFKK